MLMREGPLIMTQSVSRSGLMSVPRRTSSQPGSRRNRAPSCVAMGCARTTSPFRMSTTLTGSSARAASLGDSMASMPTSLVLRLISALSVMSASVVAASDAASLADIAASLAASPDASRTPPSRRGPLSAGSAVSLSSLAFGLSEGDASFASD